MGLFDDLECQYQLPIPGVQHDTFQTKSLGCTLAVYVLDSAGFLWKTVEFSHPVQPPAQVFPENPVRFYTSRNEGGFRWYEFEAIFDDNGRVRILRRVPQE